MALHCLANFYHLRWECAAVGITQNQTRRTAVGSSLQGGECVLGRVLVTVEKVLGIIHYLAAMLDEVGDGVADHRLIFRDGRTEDFGDLELPAFSENRNHRGLRFEQKADLWILLDRRVGTAGGAEGRELGMGEFQALRLAEKLDVFGIRAGPATFDVVDAEFVQALGDAELIQARKLESFALSAIAQGRVVKKYRFGAHRQGGER